MTLDPKTLTQEERALWDAMAIQERRNRRVASESYSETEGSFRDLLKARRALFGEPASEGKVECPKSAAIEREAREESKSFAKRTFESGIAVDMGQIGASERGFYFGFKAAATLREKALAEVTGERNALIMSVHFKLEEIIAKDAEIATLRAKLAAVPVDEIRRLASATMLRSDLACIFRWLTTVTK